MLKSSRKALSTARSSFTSEELTKKELYKEERLLKPEERFLDEALEDIYYRSLITIALGKNFTERTDIRKKEVERFTLLYGTDPKNVKISTYTGIIPLRKKGHAWESKPSSAVRKKYKLNADKMFDRLEICNFGSENVNSGSIELCDVPFKTTDYLEFSSAAALVDKRPHKRKGHNSGDSVYFKDFYLNGKRGMLFGVFDALSSKSKNDYKLSISMLSLFKKFFNSVSFADNPETVFTMFSEFLNHSELSIQFSDSNPGVSMLIGLVYSDYLYYMNIGDCRAYVVSLNGKPFAKKVTIDDGMSGLVERGALITKKEFFSQLKSPELFLGGFSQPISNKNGNRVLHNKIKLKSPNIGKVTLKGSNFILAATDGFWTNLPILTEKDVVTDASGEKAIESILLNSNLKNPLSILESLYDYSKSNMKLKRTNTRNNSTIKPNPQDIGLLGFFI